MANNTSTNEDPSIEEILDSIRQIISEDDSAPEESAVSDVMDMVDDEPPAMADDFDMLPPMEESLEPESEPEDDDVFELVEKIDDSPKPQIEVDLIDMDDQPEPPELPEPKFEAPAAIIDDVDPESILTEAAENAAYDAMTSLVRKTAVEHNGITLEDIVRTELKPMLRAWLDKNLPIIIERLVREELERVSKRALDE